MIQVAMSWIKGEFKTGDVTRYGDALTPENDLRVQVENHLRLGGQSPIIATNFPFEHMGVKAIEVPVEAGSSAFTTKLPTLSWLIKNNFVNQDFLWKDCDVHTLRNHSFPEEVDGIGMVRHSLPSRTKVQGGVMYCRKDCYDMIHEMAEYITKHKVHKEELVLVELLKDKPFTYLNYRYNFFRQSEFGFKYPLTELPIINCHFHVQYKNCYDCFVLGKNKLGIKVVPEELKLIMDKYVKEHK